VPPPSDFRPRRPRRNIAGVVIPFFTSMPLRHRCQLNKVCSNSATNACLLHPMECSELSREQCLADVQSCLTCMGTRPRRQLL
jgi:hypothetical protein